jgi:hypothetical protein
MKLWEIRHRWCSLKVRAWFLICAFFYHVAGALIAGSRVVNCAMTFCRDRAVGNIAKMKRIREDATS